MKPERDRLDAHDVAWFEAKAQLGDWCHRCGASLSTRMSVLVERVLPGVGARPKTLHRKCRAAHNERLTDVRTCNTNRGS